MAPEQTLESPQKPPFSRIIAPDEKGAARAGRIEASAAERAALAGFYRLDTIAALTLDYTLDPLPSGRWRLTGLLEGALTQLCVITLEPVAETVHENVSVEFWPAHLLEQSERDIEPEDILEAEPPEPLVNGRIDLGHLTAELFASAINPYPRKPGAEFDWTDPKAAGEEGGANPFAALAKLKGKG